MEKKRINEFRYCNGCSREIPLTGRLWKCFYKYELWLCRGCEKVKDNGNEIKNGGKVIK